MGVHFILKWTLIEKFTADESLSIHSRIPIVESCAQVRHLSVNFSEYFCDRLALIKIISIDNVMVYDANSHPSYTLFTSMGQADYLYAQAITSSKYNYKIINVFSYIFIFVVVSVRKHRCQPKQQRRGRFHSEFNQNWLFLSSRKVIACRLCSTAATLSHLCWEAKVQPQCLCLRTK